MTGSSVNKCKSIWLMNLFDAGITEHRIKVTGDSIEVDGNENHLPNGLDKELPDLENLLKDFEGTTDYKIESDIFDCIDSIRLMEVDIKTTEEIVCRVISGSLGWILQMVNENDESISMTSFPRNCGLLLTIGFVNDIQITFLNIRRNDNAKSSDISRKSSKH